MTCASVRAGAPGSRTKARASMFHRPVIRSSHTRKTKNAIAEPIAAQRVGENDDCAGEVASRWFTREARKCLKRRQ